VPAAPAEDHAAGRDADEPLHDAVVVGGGPAGLSAALWLGRFRRDVVVVDGGAPRNEDAWAVHGFPGLPDPHPHALRRVLRDQAAAAGARLVAGEAMEATGERGAFRVVLAGGEALRTRRLILAYGLRDHVPAVPGLGDLYGTSVFHCPDCDGPSAEGEHVGVLGRDRGAANAALYLLHWAASVTLLTNGRGQTLPADDRAVLAREGIRVLDAAVSRAVGAGGRLVRMELEDSERVPLSYLFFHLGSEPCTRLAERLGCAVADDVIEVDRGHETSVPGIYAVGDLTGAPFLAAIAAAEGVRSALACHRSLLPEERMIG
jgi:thioredoxin reductase